MSFYLFLSHHSANRIHLVGVVLWLEVNKQIIAALLGTGLLSAISTICSNQRAVSFDILHLGFSPMAQPFINTNTYAARKNTFLILLYRSDFYMVTNFFVVFHSTLCIRWNCFQAKIYYKQVIWTDLNISKAWE